MLLTKSENHTKDKGVKETGCDRMGTPLLAEPSFDQLWRRMIGFVTIVII